jgi:hypothetical protein
LPHQVERLLGAGIVLWLEFAIAQLVVGDKKFLDFVDQMRTKVRKAFGSIMRLSAPVMSSRRLLATDSIKMSWIVLASRRGRPSLFLPADLDRRFRVSVSPRRALTERRG